MGHFYAASTNDWDKVAAALLRQADRGRASGLDSEFYNVKIREQSCVGRSKLHLWSVAINRFPLQLHPRGYFLADAAVLGVDSLEHRGLRQWLESDAPKAVHNLPVDAHTFGNHGIRVGGAINTLARARFCFPERARGFPVAPGFDLDGLGSDVLGIGKTEDGWVSEDYWRKHKHPRDPAIFVRILEEQVTKKVRAEVCSCGERKCRKRKGHSRPVTEKLETVLKWGGTIPLEEVKPGVKCFGCQSCSFHCDHWIAFPHERWERALAYAARDSLVALYLNDRMDKLMDGRIPFPWQ